MPHQFDTPYFFEELAQPMLLFADEMDKTQECALGQKWHSLP